MSQNKEKTYLKWYNKIGYGSGDIAGNVVYALLSAFVMIFLTDTVGMNAGVVGTLIAISKLFDGVSDIGYYFGIDQQGGSGPLTDVSLAWNASPLKYINNVQTPTLFIHSEEDHRCPDEQAFQIFTALQVRGIESRLCYFLGENHELSRSGKPRSRLARLREITQWMDRFLK